MMQLCFSWPLQFNGTKKVKPCPLVFLLRGDFWWVTCRVDTFSRGSGIWVWSYHRWQHRGSLTVHTAQPDKSMFHVFAKSVAFQPTGWLCWAPSQERRGIDKHVEKRFRSGVISAEIAGTDLPLPSFGNLQAISYLYTPSGRVSVRDCQSNICGLRG